MNHVSPEIAEKLLELELTNFDGGPDQMFYDKDGKLFTMGFEVHFKPQHKVIPAPTLDELMDICHVVAGDVDDISFNKDYPNVDSDPRYRAWIHINIIEYDPDGGGLLYTKTLEGESSISFVDALAFALIQLEGKK